MREAGREGKEVDRRKRGRLRRDVSVYVCTV